MWYPFYVSDNTDVAPKSQEKLLQLVHKQSDKLLVELAVNYDVGEPIVKATYTLEGDGPLALKWHEVLSVVKAAVQVQHWSNTTAIAKKIATQQHSKEDWMKYASNCVKPGLDYFTAKFDGDLLPLVDAFKSACLFDPTKVSDMKPNAAAVDTLRSFKLLDDEVIKSLKSEVPSCLAAADGIALTVDPLEWWERHSEMLPQWSAACKKVLLCQPSSAAVERVFSILNNTFSHSQFSALEDYIEITV